jgi:hypothetical protein
MPSNKDECHSNDCFGYVMGWGDNHFRKIIIYNDCSLKQQRITLIHELGHVYYRVMGNGFEKPDSKIEDVLTVEAERFVCENADFVGALIKKLDKSNYNKKSVKNKKIDYFINQNP